LNSGGSLDLAANYAPTENNKTYLVFGVASAGTTPIMPFNRADYYIRIPAAADMSQRCAPGTGILYKATLDQATGAFTETPLMDCVGDIQVVFDLATGAPSNNTVNFHVDNLSSLATLFEIVSQVKAVRLYILTHEGQRDSNYSYPSNSIFVGESFDLGVTNLGRIWTAADMAATFTNWQDYYWKVLKLVVIPNNLYN
jgi:hypothetical protein